MIFQSPIFRDRRDAGRKLARALYSLRSPDLVILALPRGGVPVAFEVAIALHAPLDVLLVRKIGMPGHEELALGAVVDGNNPQVVLNEDIIAQAALAPGWLEESEHRKLIEIERRRRLYRGSEPAIDVRSRIVVVVDDGIATGATLKAALKGLRRNQLRRLIVAVPVAPSDVVAELENACDEVLCLSMPDPFYAVGQYYDDFRPTSDEEVVWLLAEARRILGPIPEDHVRAHP